MRTFSDRMVAGRPGRMKAMEAALCASIFAVVAITMMPSWI